MFYKKAKIAIFTLSLLTTILLAEYFYLGNTKALSKEQIKQKNEFVSLVGLPDLAISTEATFIRHRSLSSMFDIYKDDGVLREYFPSSFAIMTSNMGKNNE